jgi:hypothetical protein
VSTLDATTPEGPPLHGIVRGCRRADRQRERRKRQDHVVAITIPITKTNKASTYRINMILEMGIKIGIVFLQLISMPELSLELPGRVFTVSLQFLLFFCTAVILMQEIL